MKQQSFTLLLIMLMSMISTKAFAYDIAVENEDGVTIYYNYINNGLELEVTYASNPDYGSDYKGDNIRIPETVTFMNRTRKVTSIGTKAFYKYASLISITIGSNINNIGKEAFYKCTGLKKVIVKDIAAWCNISIENSDGNPLSYAHHLYSDENTEITELIIPNNVTTIGRFAFFGCLSLTSVTIGNSVISIGVNAFCRCDNLHTITIPSSLKTIGASAFGFCDSLNKVIVNDLLAWFNIEFKDSFSNPLACAHHLYGNEYTEIIDLVIPSGVITIGRNALADCHGLIGVTIPNSVTTIGNSAFRLCTGLKDITIPNSVTSIGREAFENCQSLTYATIGNRVEDIGMNAFRGCHSLTYVTIGNKVEDIGESAFDNCDNLATVKCFLTNPMTIGSNVFSKNTLFNATLIVPKGTISKYKATEGWNKFLWIEEMGETSIKSVTMDNIINDGVYSLDGKPINNFQQGIKILRMKNGMTRKVIQ